MDWLARAMEDLHGWIGRTGDPLTAAQMSLRASIAFLYGLVILRIAPSRIFGKSAVLDIILSVIIGSNLSRMLTGNAPFLPTLVATAVLVALHWLLASVAFRFRPFADLVKGKPIRLVERGEIDWDHMRSHGIGRRDLQEAMREQGVTQLAEVRRAMLERDGSISIVTN